MCCSHECCTAKQAGAGRGSLSGLVDRGGWDPKPLVRWVFEWPFGHRPAWHRKILEGLAVMLGMPHYLSSFYVPMYYVRALLPVCHRTLFIGQNRTMSNRNHGSGRQMKIQEDASIMKGKSCCGASVGLYAARLTDAGSLSSRFRRPPAPPDSRQQHKVLIVGGPLS